MHNNDIFFLYKSIAAATQSMLVAARNGQWEQLAALEGQCAQYATLLKYNETSVTLNDEQHAHKLQLVKKIMDDNKNICNLVEHQLEQLSVLIHNTSTQLKLNKAYSATPGDA